MRTFSEIPYSFLKDNYFLLSIIIDNRWNGCYYDFSIRDMESFDGSIEDYIQMVEKRIERENRKRDFNELEKIHRSKDYIENLYDALEGEMKIPIYFILTFKLKERYFSQKALQSRLKEIFTKAGALMSIKDALKYCDYTIETEKELHFLAKLSYQWPQIKKDYISYVELFTGDDSDDVYQSIRSFIDTYTRYKPSTTLPDKWDSSEAFEKLFKYRERAQVYSYAEIASQYGLTVERIRQKMIEKFNDCKDILEYQYRRKGTYGNLHSLFEHIKEDISQHQILPVSTDSYLEFWNRTDQHTRLFIEKTLNIETYDEPDIVNELYIYNDRINKKIVTETINEVITTFSKYPLPISIRLDLDKTISKIKLSNTHKELFRNIIRSSKIFIRDINGEEGSIMIKYQYLKTQDDRIARIVYEFPNHECEKTQILEVYNKRARLYGLDEIQEVTRNSKLIEKVGKTGIWKCNPNISPKNTTGNSLKEVIQNYLKVCDNIEALNFEQLVKYIAEEKGESYKVESIRTTLNTLGYKRDGETYILNQNRKLPRTNLIQCMAEILKAKGSSMSRQALIMALESTLGCNINYGSVTLALNAASDLFKQEKDGKKVIVSLMKNDWDLNDYDSNNKTPEYHYEIIQTAIDELLRAEGHTLKLRELKNLLSKCIPTRIHENIIYKLISRDPRFIKENQGNVTYISLSIDEYKKASGNAEHCFKNEELAATSELSYDYDWSTLRAAIIRNYGRILVNSESSCENVLDYMRKAMKADNKNNQSWRILELMNRVFFKPTTIDERELLAFKMVLEVENYLTNICIEHNCKDIPEGLAHIIFYMQSKRLLPNRDEYHHRLNRQIGRIIDIRNKYAHKGNSNQVISDTIKLFLEFYYSVADYIVKTVVS